MMGSSLVVSLAVSFLGDGALLNERAEAPRSARLLAQADAPAVSISEMDKRIELLRSGRRGIGGSIAGIVVGASLVLPGVIFIALGVGAEALGVALGVSGAGLVSFIIGGVFLGGGILLIVLCSIGIASSGKHNAAIDEEIRVMQGERDKMVGKPVSMWAPSLTPMTLARF